MLYTSDAGGESQLWMSPWDEAAGTMGSPRSPLTAVEGGADGADLVAGCEAGAVCGGGVSGVLGLGDWAEEDACDKAKDEAAAKSPVKAQLWTSLLYRHWNALRG